MEANTLSKTNKDYLVRATALQGQVQAVAIRHTKACNEMTKIHNLSPIACAALGRFTGGLLLMSTDLKSKNSSMSATIKSDGDLKGMVGVVTPDATVKGYVLNPNAKTIYKHKGKLDVGVSVGKGTLTVVKNLGLKEPYVGQVELISGEIAQDLAAYHLYSEQIPTVMGLGVKLTKEGVTHAGGFMIRLLPDASSEVLEYVEKRALGFPEVTWLMEEGFTPHQILDLFFGDPKLKYLSEQECFYKCNCSKEKMTKNLLALGKDELESLGKDPEGIKLECHFCDKKYHFTNKEIGNLI